MTASGSGGDVDDRVTVIRVPVGETYARVTRISRRTGTTFVLVPGFSISATYFEIVAPALSELGPVVAVELPGVGGIPDPGGTGTVDAAARSLGHVLDELGVDAPLLVGQSMGSQVAAALGARRDGVTGLVLVGPIVAPERRGILRTLLAFARVAVHEPPSVAVIAAFSYLLVGPGALRRTLPSVVEFALEERLPRISAPTRILSGSLDRLATDAWLAHLDDACTAAQVTRVPGGAHSVIHAHATAVVAACAELVGAPAPDVSEAADGRRRLREIPGALRFRLAEFGAMRRQDDARLQRLKRRKLAVLLAERR